MHRLASTLQLVLTASGTASVIRAASEAPAAEIPFSWTPGQIEMQVSVQGAPPVTFLLDTGGVLGNEVLRRFRVTIDYSRRMLGLEPTARLREVFVR
jgi:hypothetical protein